MKLDHTLDEVRPQIIINNLKKSDTWKIQLTITINLISSKDDNDEEDVVHSQHDNIEIMISDEADEVIKKLFDSLKNIYQSNLGSIVFDHVKLLYYKCHKINLNHGGSYIESPDRIKKSNRKKK